jgi:SAM-dependent methyltransferase
MKKVANREPEYGNWVSKKLLYSSGTLSLIGIGFSVLYMVLIIPALFFSLTFIYFVYARFRFSPSGGNLQEKIRDLVLDYLKWDGNGNTLDIGCGNGPLAIKLAKTYPKSHVTGIDYWQGLWDYSQDICEKNASLEKVSDRTTFQKASASHLPFNDGHFDAVVSNFVFHEVSDTKDKRDVIKEALRVVKKNGVFSFQDLFLIKRMYGDPEDLLETIKSWGIENVYFVRTNELDFIPWALKLPFMVGKIGIIHGRK